MPVQKENLGKNWTRSSSFRQFGLNEKSESTACRPLACLLPFLSSSCSSLNFSSVSPFSSNLAVNSLTWFSKSRLVSSPTGLQLKYWVNCICQSRHPAAACATGVLDRFCDSATIALDMGWSISSINGVHVLVLIVSLHRRRSLHLFQAPVLFSWK